MLDKRGGVGPVPLARWYGTADFGSGAVELEFVSVHREVTV